jgi:hypothetical protein
MARQDSQFIFKTDGETEQVLREVYAGVLDNFETSALSSIVKNKNLSGDPRAGSVEVDRILNAAVEDYDVDASDKGIKIEKVTINVDTPKMIRERFTKWDIDQYGIDGLVGKRSDMYARSMVRFADRLFFETAESAGTERTLTSETTRAKIDELIRYVSDAYTDYADGVETDLIHLFLKSDKYDDFKASIDTYPNPAGGGVTVGDYGGIRVYRNHRQTEDAIVMAEGSIGFPIAPIGVDQDKIPGSVEYYLGLFFKYGIEAVMPELISYADLGSTEESA